jgi:hypothetical protein
VLIVEEDSAELKFDSYRTKSLVQNEHEKIYLELADESEELKEKQKLITSFKMLLDKSSKQLLARFEREDAQKSGWIKLLKWASIISEYLKELYGESVEPRNLIILKNYLCTCDDQKSMVNYLLMFKNGQKLDEEDEDLIDFLDSIFNMIDLDGKHRKCIDDF